MPALHTTGRLDTAVIALSLHRLVVSPITLARYRTKFQIPQIDDDGFRSVAVVVVALELSISYPLISLTKNGVEIRIGIRILG